MPRLARIATAAIAGTLTVAAVAACGSDSPKTNATASSSSSEDPHTKVSTDAEVATGLHKMEDEAAEVLAAASDKSEAEAAGDELHETWEDIEGTVKQNEPDMYAQIEEDLAVLRDADKDATAKQAAEDDLGVVIDQYLAKHPGS